MMVIGGDYLRSWLLKERRKRKNMYNLNETLYLVFVSGQ